MATVAHAIVTLVELKAYGGWPGSSRDTAMEYAINAATDFLELRLGRRVVKRTAGEAAITEWHTLACPDNALFLGDFPVASVTSIHESTDSPRVYDATTLLAADEYQLVASRGMVRRVESSIPRSWAVGHRTVQVIYTPGYEQASVPWDLKQVALFVAASVFQEGSRAGWGVSSTSDAAGNVTRFMGYLPPSMEQMLKLHERHILSRTWERAA